VQVRSDQVAGQRGLTHIGLQVLRPGGRVAVGLTRPRHLLIASPNSHRQTRMWNNGPCYIPSQTLRASPPKTLAT
jgi:hypothetical protein